MEWVPDISVGGWIAESLAEQPWGSLRSFVPGGFEAYARVFHPFTRDRPVGRTWGEVNAHSARGDYFPFDTEGEEVSWAETAARFGTAMHPLAQSHALLGRAYGDSSERLDADGWRYEGPAEGQLSIELLARLATVLGRYSSGSAVTAGIWEGWGGLTSANSARYYAVRSEGLAGAVMPIVMAIARPFLLSRARGRARRAMPGSGRLPADAAAGPRLELPGRDYILFRSGLDVYQTDAWTRTAPWLDSASGVWEQTPSLMWPEDRAWFLATEIDYNTTIIGGSAQLIAELVRTDGIEAAAISIDDALTIDGDTINS